MWNLLLFLSLLLFMSDGCYGAGKYLVYRKLEDLTSEEVKSYLSHHAFCAVEEGKLYRARAVDKAWFIAGIKAYKIKTIITLSKKNGEGPQPQTMELTEIKRPLLAEEDSAGEEELNVSDTIKNVFDIPISYRGLIDQKHIKRLLDCFEKKELQPMLITSPNSFNEADFVCALWQLIMQRKSLREVLTSWFDHYYTYGKTPDPGKKFLIKLIAKKGKEWLEKEYNYSSYASDLSLYQAERSFCKGCCCCGDICCNCCIPPSCCTSYYWEGMCWQYREEGCLSLFSKLKLC